MRLQDFFLDGDGGREAERGRLWSAVLSGPPGAAKGTLLFQYAYNLVARRGYANAVIVCRRNWTKEERLLLPEDFLESAAEYLNKISIKYVADDEDLDKYFATLHLANPVPQAVLIDDLCGLFEEWLYDNHEGRELAIVNSLSLCLNAMEHASQVWGPTKDCHLLMSETQEEGINNRYIFEKYLSHVLLVQALGSSRFVLSDSAEKDAYAQYTLQGGTIRLECLVPT